MKKIVEKRINAIKRFINMIYAILLNLVKFIIEMNLRL